MEAEATVQSHAPGQQASASHAPDPALATEALGSTSGLRALQLQWVDKEPGFQVRDSGAEAQS